MALFAMTLIVCAYVDVSELAIAVTSAFSSISMTDIRLLIHFLAPNNPAILLAVLDCCCCYGGGYWPCGGGPLIYGLP